MNKCDLITQDWRESLQAFLPTLAPKAKIFEAENGFLSEGEEALLAHSLRIGRQHQTQEMGEAKQYNHEERHNHEKDHHHEHQNHGHAHESIHTVSFALDQPVDRASFEQLLHGLPKTIYRAKGFVTFLGDQETYVFQHLPGYVRIKRFPLQDRALLRGVFIGKDLEKQGLALQLQRCLHTA
jgi:G3E family GTPase